MSAAPASTPIEVHTLTSLCTELVSGRAVSTSAEGMVFKFGSEQTRAIFDWYRRNPDKWARNVATSDVEAFADEVGKTPPVLPSAAGISSGQAKRVLHLRSIRAHRFAGLHWFGSVEAAPEDFEFTFRSPLTLVYGANGVGKTSLLSAINWCLSGHIHRSLRAPETADALLPVTSDDNGDPGTDLLANDISAITPLPPLTVLKKLQGKPVPLDTWVELTFTDDSGAQVATVRRSVGRTPKGKLQVTASDPSQLGVSPIALEVGTKMPALIPYLPLGEPSDLGQAVASLTGLKPLRELVTHATKCERKLRRDLVEQREQEIAELDSDYCRARDELLTLLNDNPAICPPQAVPIPSGDRAIENILESCTWPSGRRWP